MANLRTANCSIITSRHQDQLWLELKYSITVKLYINTSRPEMAVSRCLSQLYQYRTGRTVSQQSGYSEFKLVCTNVRIVQDVVTAVRSHSVLFYNVTDK